MDEAGYFTDFGFDAEENYSQSNGGGRKSLFRNFKMRLHENEVIKSFFSILNNSIMNILKTLMYVLQKNLTKFSMIESVEGVLRPAIDVISFSLKFLKDHFLESVSKSSGR